MRRSRVPVECSEAKPNGTRPGTQRDDSRSATWSPAAISRVAPRSRVSLRSPGTREGSAHDACDIAARAANRWPSSYSRCQTAQCCSFPRRVAAPGFVRLFACAFAFASAGEPTGLWRRGRRDSSNSVPPMRGGWSADRRTLSSVAPATRDHPVPGRPGPLSALHRGGFRMRTHEAGSRQWNRSRSDFPRQAIKAWRSGSGPPALRFAPQAWDATPCSVFQDRF